MSAEDRLRRYLEQRREMGESELVLDGMTVDDVMKVLGAARTREAGRPREAAAPPKEAPAAASPRLATPAPQGGGDPAPPEPEGRASNSPSADWREQLRASGASAAQLRDFDKAMAEMDRVMRQLEKQMRAFENPAGD